MSTAGHMPVTGERPPPQWRDRRLLDLFGIEQPLVLAPMAGPGTAALAGAVCRAGGLGSLACATLTPAAALAAVAEFRACAVGSVNMNFFCHPRPAIDPVRESRWHDRLDPYYRELGLVRPCPLPILDLPPFDNAMCEVVEQARPAVASFHFGLPEPHLLARVKQAGCRIVSSATSVEEARWLVARGVDAIIAQGHEAGGHQGSFVPGTKLETAEPACGTLNLVQAIRAVIDTPLLAAGGIADGADIAAALTAGAAGVQIGTAYLLCPEAATSPAYRDALTRPHQTVMTNVFTGKLARAIVNRLTQEVGPVAWEAPAFPMPMSALAPLWAEAERRDRFDLSAFWAGQAPPSTPDLPAETLTRSMMAEARSLSCELPQ